MGVWPKIIDGRGLKHYAHIHPQAGQPDEWGSG